MSSLSRIRIGGVAAEKLAYWGAVEDCLVHFHQLSKPMAHGKTNALRRKLASLPTDIDADIIYHDEPFYVACDIAGMHDIPDQERLLGQSRAEYQSLMDQRGR